MSEEQNPLPPVPEHTPPLKEDEVGPAPGKFFNQAWNRWFTSLRTKVNVINDAVTSLSNLVGNGLVVMSGGNATTVSLTDLVAGTNVAFPIPGTGTNRIIDNGTGPLTINATGGGGSAAWELVTAVATIPNPTPYIEVNVTDYNEVMVVIQNATAASNSYRSVVVSTDGSTFYGGGSDYVAVPSDGAGIFSFLMLNNSGAATTAARYAGGILTTLRLNGTKAFLPIVPTGYGALFTASLDPITHIRIVSMAAANTYVNLTGGSVYVYGR
jgi:hypothetical protein